MPKKPGPWTRHLAGSDGITHSFLTNYVTTSGQSGGSYRTDTSKL